MIREISGGIDVSGLTEEELLDKINKDVAAWKSSQDEENSGNWDVLENTLNEVRPVEKTSDFNIKRLNQAKNKPEEDTYYFEPIE